MIDFTEFNEEFDSIIKDKIDADITYLKDYPTNKEGALQDEILSRSANLTDTYVPPVVSNLANKYGGKIKYAFTINPMLVFVYVKRASKMFDEMVYERLNIKFE